MVGKIIRLLLVCSSMPLHGYAAVESSNTRLSGIKAIAKKGYITIGCHDGGQKTGFFIPIILKGGQKCVWWDIGSVGFHMGYRKILDSNWFTGIYLGFDVMNERLSLLPLFHLYPTRVNGGFEISQAHVGKLTGNFYRVIYHSEEISRS
jgi:hypothetical protein